jgi:LacI family transcriptional regulator
MPSLTTIRQPLQQMGSAGAEALLRHLGGEHLPHVLRVEPELIVRESTGPVRRSKAPGTTKAASTKKAASKRSS